MSDLPQRSFADMLGLFDEVDSVLSQTTPPGVMYVLYVTAEGADSYGAGLAS
ncbi:hypothetical protein [Candidatus Poriferisodalis sp.]|uniref:hypothetical protein n=1 Tax=Candidatus Poriferisodalis sp. TaxID=3101277 RepID=UPI003B02264F